MCNTNRNSDPKILKNLFKKCELVQGNDWSLNFGGEMTVQCHLKTIQCRLGHISSNQRSEKYNDAASQAAAAAASYLRH